MWEMEIWNVDLYHVLSWLLIYSFLGWVWETCYVSIKKGRYVNRGFINGPLCTIYGFGAVLIYFILKPISENLVLLFFGGIVVATTLEYLTAVLMESIFHTSWWDYSDKRLNFQGRICLGASLGWGAASVIFFRILHPMVKDFVELYPRFIGEVSICVILAAYAVDFAYSAASAFHLHDKLLVWEKDVEVLQGEFFLKMNKRMNTWMQKNGFSLDFLKERLEDGQIFQEIEKKRASLQKELSRELDARKEALAARLDHNLKRYLKSYPNLNRGYRLHREKKEQRRNKSSK